jgi:hypothetical protein
MVSVRWQGTGSRDLPNVLAPQALSARQVCELYRRRCIELLIKELRGAMGLGQHEVTKEPQWIERSEAIAVMAAPEVPRTRYS